MKHLRTMSKFVPLAMLTLAALAPEATAAGPAAGPAWNHLTGAVRKAGPGLVPLGILAAWIGMHTLKRRLRYRRSVLIPKPIFTMLDELRGDPDRRRGRIAPDAGKLAAAIEYHRGPLSRIVKAALAAAGRPYAERKDDLVDTIDIEMGRLGRPNASFVTQYVTSTLWGLLSAVVVLVAAFGEAAEGGPKAAARIYAAIGPALVPTAAGALLAIICKNLGDHFLKLHEERRDEIFSLTRPLLDVGNSSPDDPGYGAGMKPATHQDEPITLLPSLDKPRVIGSLEHRNNSHP